MVFKVLLLHSLVYIEISNFYVSYWIPEGTKVVILNEYVLQVILYNYLLIWHDRRKNGFCQFLDLFLGVHTVLTVGCHECDCWMSIKINTIWISIHINQCPYPHTKNPSSLGKREAGKPGYVTSNSCTGRFFGVKSTSSIVNISDEFRGSECAFRFQVFFRIRSEWWVKGLWLNTKERYFINDQVLYKRSLHADLRCLMSLWNF